MAKKSEVEPVFYFVGATYEHMDAGEYGFYLNKDEAIRAAVSETEYNGETVYVFEARLVGHGKVETSFMESRALAEEIEL